MQIDFHHGVIYVLARLANFDQNQAKIIAYSSQYVDEATNGAPILFANGAIYNPVCSAHKILDYRNFDKLANHLVWTPFHFLPGNCNFTHNEGSEIEFTERIICQPNSFVAKDMIDECIRKADDYNSLYRLGITLHVYADTWAHRGFAGIQSNVNRVEYLEDNNVSKTLVQKLINYFSDKFDKNESRFIDEISPLGHGAVLSYPDLPYLKWRYKNYNGELIERNNPKEYLDAARNIFKVMKCFLKDNININVEKMFQDDFLKIAQYLEDFNDNDGEIRHLKWLDKIKTGEFSFGPEDVIFDHNNTLWELIALGVINESEIPLRNIKYTEGFKSSDWKKFQDALADHHYYVIRKLFPKYDFCLA